MDSAIGTSLVVAIGPERFAELLAGMHAIDYDHHSGCKPNVRELFCVFI